MFRTVTEDNSVDLNRKNYAQMKRNVCNARAKNLNHLLQSSQTTDNGTASVRYSRVDLTIMLKKWFTRTLAARIRNDT